MKQTAFVFALLLLIGAVDAAKTDTLSYADAAQQLYSACRGDLQKYCRGVELGGGRLKGCLDGHQNVLSPQCQQTRAVVYVSIARRAAAQRNIGNICSADIERLCGTSHADANLVTCLRGIAPVAISPQCNDAFTDTGWRTERPQQ